jgi:carbonic anhydrase
MLSICQSTPPARAEQHQAQALVLSCIDFRFLASELEFLAMQKLGNQYDLTALAGASLAVAGFPHKADTVAFWDQLDLSYRLHHINKVIILDHQDCGAYASKFGSELSSDLEREKQVHVDYLNRAYFAIRNRYPDVEVELYFAKLNTEIIPVLPKVISPS